MTRVNRKEKTLNHPWRLLFQRFLMAVPKVYLLCHFKSEHTRKLSWVKTKDAFWRRCSFLCSVVEFMFSWFSSVSLNIIDKRILIYKYCATTNKKKTELHFPSLDPKRRNISNLFLKDTYIFLFYVMPLSETNKSVKYKRFCLPKKLLNA